MVVDLNQLAITEPLLVPQHGGNVWLGRQSLLVLLPNDTGRCGAHGEQTSRRRPPCRIAPPAARAASRVTSPVPSRQSLRESPAEALHPVTPNGGWGRLGTPFPTADPTGPPLTTLLCSATTSSVEEPQRRISPFLGIAAETSAAQPCLRRHEVAAWVGTPLLSIKLEPGLTWVRDG